MGMAQPVLVGTEVVYCVGGREVYRTLVSSTSSAIQIPVSVLAAANSNHLNLVVRYQHFDRRAEFTSRAERRGKKFKNSHGPQTQWWNKR